MTAYRTRTSRHGFTLVEILIVVIILGILAAIVIPQFTNASEDARKNSLTSQLQTVRSQLELAKVQHHDNVSPLLILGGANSWNDLTIKTDDTYTQNSPSFGPYLNAAPANPLNSATNVSVITSGNEPAFNDSVSGGGTSVGWVYYQPTGKLFATTKLGDKIYNESTGDNAEQ